MHRQLREPYVVEEQRHGRVVHPPCPMVIMVARSLTETRPASSTFWSIVSKWPAVTCWLTSYASLPTLMFTSGGETKFFRYNALTTQYHLILEASVSPSREGPWAYSRRARRCLIRVSCSCSGTPRSICPGRRRAPSPPSTSDIPGRCRSPTSSGSCRASPGRTCAGAGTRTAVGRAMVSGARLGFRSLRLRGVNN